MKTRHILWVLLFFVTLYSSGQNVDISGFARTYEGVNVETGDFTIIQQTLNLNFEKRGEKVAFKANPMVYMYNADKFELNMREIYADMYFKNFD